VPPTELGHVMSGHVTYSTIAVILLNVGLKNLPSSRGSPCWPIQVALLEWYRKESSLRSRRVARTQTPRLPRHLLKLAGGFGGR